MQGLIEGNPLVRALAERLSEGLRVVIPPDRLLDFSHPAVRDAWVRWGIEQEEARAINREAAYYEQQQTAWINRWCALRDRPHALEAAVSAAVLAHP